MKNQTKLLSFFRDLWPGLPQDQLLPFTNLMRCVYSWRPDLQQAFDITTHGGRRKYLQWFMSMAHLESLKPFFDNTLIFSPPTVRGVNVIGYSRGELGLGEDCRQTAFALQESRISSSIYHCAPQNGLPEKDNSAAVFENAQLPHQINLFNLPGTNQFELALKMGDSFFANRYNIGFWAWELENWPGHLDYCLNLNQEIWAISQFVKDSLSSSPIPVFVMPQAVVVPEVPVLNLGKYGVPDDTFNFVFVFDFNSSLFRKNPYAVVEAFKKAFQKNEKVHLVIKVMLAKDDNPEWIKFKTTCDIDSRITILNLVMDRNEVMSLVKSADCFVSLHRSEGFGRGIAEAMLMGKPCIVTNYSGNTDFCKKDNSYLVDCERVPVKHSEYQYVLPQETNYWGNPSVEHASELMMDVYKNPLKRNQFAMNGKMYISKNYSREAAGSAYAERIVEIEKNL